MPTDEEIKAAENLLADEKKTRLTAAALEYNAFVLKWSQKHGTKLLVETRTSGEVCEPKIKIVLIK